MASAEKFAGHAELPGVRLWYTDTGGDGVPVLLLHANTGNADGFQDNIPAFVNAGYRAIAFDRRGWGRSTANPGTGPQPGTIADDLHGLVEHLNIDRFHLVGVAGGGFAAYDYVLCHPERLRSLVIAASGGAIVDEELSKLREKTALPNFRNWPPEFREVSMGYMATNPEGLKRWLEIHNNSQQQGAPAQPQRTTITFEKLATIRVPTLLMPGDQDIQCPPWVMRRQLAHIPHAEFIIIPEASHSINWEQPEAFNRHVLEFIRKS
ncbi:MAG TPA: alpha/beta hydrolase [Candidatus Polarisedimenticolaceae bacterium]|nr:alpha/beta hydrolase [Candidatus Polarisedimenticolaceae bacterium]